MFGYESKIEEPLIFDEQDLTGWYHKNHPKTKILDSITVCSVYEGGVRNALVDWKYQREKEQGERVATLIQKIKKDFGEQVLYTWIPMGIDRILVRTFNQSSYLARTLALSKNGNCKKVFYRIWSGKHQAHLSQEKREQRNFGGIKLLRKDFSEKIIVLVDDVITTGSTLSHCARALKEAGAKEVHVVCIARSTLINR